MTFESFKIQEKNSFGIAFSKELLIINNHFDCTLFLFQEIEMDCEINGSALLFEKTANLHIFHSFCGILEIINMISNNIY